MSQFSLKPVCGIASRSGLKADACFCWVFVGTHQGHIGCGVRAGVCQVPSVRF